MKKIIFAAAVAAAAASHAQVLSRVPDADIAKMEKIVSAWKPAAPAKPRNALVFYRCEGFCHNRAIAYALRALDIAARRSGAFTFDETTDYKAMSAANLAKYDAVVLLNCTHPDTKRNPNLEKDLVDYVAKGKGLCVIHAGCDGFYDAPAAAAMIGGRFWGHPWHFGGTWSFTNDEPDHPLNRAFKDEGSPFKRVEEVYQHSSPPYERGRVRVLLSLDLKDRATAKRLKAVNRKNLRKDNDFPVSWVRRHGAGRVFYTTFGHEGNTFTDPGRLTHILDALQYTLGDLDVPDEVRK